MRRRDRFLQQVFRPKFTSPPLPTSPPTSNQRPFPTPTSDSASERPSFEPPVLPVSTNLSAGGCSPGLPTHHALSIAIERHLSTLSEAEKDRFRRASQTLTNANFFETVQAEDREHAESSLVRKRAQKVEAVFRVVDRLMAGVAIAIQANPDVSSIVVGAIRVLLSLSLPFFSFFTRLSQMIGRFDDFVKPLAEFARTRPEQTLVLESLAGVYGDFLHFCQIACAVFTDKCGQKREFASWRIFLRVQWMPFEDEFGKIESRLSHHLSVLQLSSLAVGFATALQIQDQQQAQTREDFLCWLSAFPYEERHDARCSQRHPGTGDWLLQSLEFQEWFTSHQSSVLWCCGGPGVGKSVLASNVVEYVTRERALLDDVAIAFIYYDYEAQRNGSENLASVICALLKQLCQGKMAAPHRLLKLKQDSHSAKMLGKSEYFIATAVDYYREVVIIVDALDECAEADRYEMLGFLRDIVQRLSLVKVFITSRRETGIATAFEENRTPTLQIKAENVASDIQRYVQDEVRQLRPGKNGRILHVNSDELAAEVVRTLTEKADGMFLWVRLQLENLCRVSVSHKDTEVRKALANLPAGLNETYHRILGQIETQPEYLRNLALRCFRWVLYAQRPLTSLELQHAVAPRRSHEDEVGLQEFDNISVIVGACANLIVELQTDYGYSIIRPAHYSVKEFFTLPKQELRASKFAEHLINATQVHEALASKCLSHLHDLNPHVGPRRYWHILERQHRKKPFSWYAAKGFDYHVKQASPLSEPLSRQINSLLSSNELVFTSIIQLRSTITEGESRPEAPIFLQNFPMREDLVAVEAFLYATLLFEVPELEPWRSGGDVPRFALHRACKAGLPSVVARLLQQGVSPNDRDGSDMTPLYYAADRENIALVRMLLGAGADTNAQGGFYGSALQAASARCYQKVIQVLLDRGADINIQGGFYGNALHAACAEGHEEVVQLLLNRGADINAQGGFYGNALQAVTNRGDVKVIQILLDRGADVNAQGGFYGNALQAASYGGYENIVQTLLQRGAAIGARGGYFGDALQAACARSNEKVVRLLIDMGANVNSRGGHYGSALQAAYTEGYDRVVQVLLDKGAEVNVRGGEFSNALQAACAEGHKKVGRMLLNAGADMTIRDIGPRPMEESIHAL